MREMLGPLVLFAAVMSLLGQGVAAVLGVLDLVRRVVSRIRRAIEIHETISMLRGLDDRILKDIGVNRCEVVAVAVRAIDESPAKDEAGSIIA